MAVAENMPRMSKAAKTTVFIGSTSWQIFLKCLFFVVLPVQVIQMFILWQPNSTPYPGSGPELGSWLISLFLGHIPNVFLSQFDSRQTYLVIALMIFACYKIATSHVLKLRFNSERGNGKKLRDQWDMMLLIFTVLREKRRLKGLLGDFREKHQADEAALHAEVSAVAAGGDESPEHQERIRTVHLSARVYREIRAFLIGMNVSLDDDDMSYLPEDGEKSVA